MYYKYSQRGEKSNIKENPYGFSVDFSAETLQVIREWYDVFEMLKGKNLQLGYSTVQDYHLELKER